MTMGENGGFCSAALALSLHSAGVYAPRCGGIRTPVWEFYVIYILYLLHHAAVGEANATIGLRGKLLVVGHDDESLPQFLA